MGTEESVANDSRTTEFLDVEETARNVADRLAKLDDESARYAAAASNLDTAAAATRELTASVREIGDASARALDVVASVGGPEIVARIQSLEQQHLEQTAALAKRISLAVYLAGVSAVLAFASAALALLQ